MRLPSPLPLGRGARRAGWGCADINLPSPARSGEMDLSGPPRSGKPDLPLPQAGGEGAT